MDMVRSEVGKLAAEDYSTAQHLAHASQQARERNYQDFLIVDVDAPMCRAYNAWLCERVLAVEPRIISMLYLPFNDPDAAYKTVKDFGDKKGVVGFMVTSPRYKPVHDNAYVKTYALLEEMEIG